MGETADGEWRWKGYQHDHHSHHFRVHFGPARGNPTHQHQPKIGEAGGGKHGGVVTIIIGIMNPTTPMCDPRYHGAGQDGVRRSVGHPVTHTTTKDQRPSVDRKVGPHQPQPTTTKSTTLTIVWGDEGGFGAGRPLVDRGREAPGTTLQGGGEGRVYKTADPLLF